MKRSFKISVTATCAALLFAASAVHGQDIPPNPPADEVVVAPYVAPPLFLMKGWNMLGNSTTKPIDVLATFAGQSSVATIWAWDNYWGRWKFYTPVMTPSELSAYATRWHYEVLTTIESGEGFWISANAEVPVPLVAVDTNDASVVPVKPPKYGWNLLSVTRTVDLAALSIYLSADDAPPSVGKREKFTVDSIWQWDPIRANWYFYSYKLEFDCRAAASAAAEADIEAATISCMNAQIEANGYESPGDSPNGWDAIVGHGFWANIGQN